jgi:hypothetical protein
MYPLLGFLSKEKHLVVELQAFGNSQGYSYSFKMN